MLTEPALGAPVGGRLGRARAGARLRLSRPPAGLVVLAVVTVVLLFVPLFAPHDSGTVVGAPLAGPSWAHPFGLDDQGRDVFSRVLLGMRTSWFAGIALIGAGILVGGLVGLLAGMSGRRLDNALMRLTDVFLSLPGPLVALAIVAAIGPGLGHTVIALSVIWWPYYARIVRGEVHAIMSRPFIESARMGGVGRMRLAARHVLPGTTGVVLVAATLDMSTVLLTLAGLSFLGLGSEAPAAELGAMTAQGLTYVFTNWWVPVWPAVGVFLLAFLANACGDAIRDPGGR